MNTKRKPWKSYRQMKYGFLGAPGDRNLLNAMVWPNIFNINCAVCAHNIMMSSMTLLNDLFRFRRKLTLFGIYDIGELVFCKQAA